LLYQQRDGKAVGAVQGFVVSADWAFERYSYRSTDTPRDGGPVVEET
jgi:hypothetical protein